MTSRSSKLKEGREGLEQYRALVERVTRQVANAKTHVASLEAKVKAYLQAADRETAAKFALELQKAKAELAENQSQLQLHEEAYNNSLEKIKHASSKLAQIREKIQKYDAELKMSRAEAEIAKLAQSLKFDVTTDFGEIETVIQEKISLNRAKVRVAAEPLRRGSRRCEARAGDGKGDGRPGSSRVRDADGARNSRHRGASPKPKKRWAPAAKAKESTTQKA
jgi:phage shock protein A